MDSDEEVARRVGELAQALYGPGEGTIALDGSTASVLRDGSTLCAVTAFDGFPLLALERFLVKRIARAETQAEANAQARAQE